jgi:hypothetical protein
MPVAAPLMFATAIADQDQLGINLEASTAVAKQTTQTR